MKCARSLILLNNSYNELIYICCNRITMPISHEKPMLAAFTLLSYCSRS